MYDIERMNKIIMDIEAYFLKLKNIGLSKDNVNMDEKFFSSSMIIFGILNRSINLAEEILIKNEFGMPTNYADYFEKLGKESIISKELAEQLKELMKSRNIFSHEYYNVNKKLVLKLSKDIYAAKDFVERVKKLLEKEGKTNSK